jgi:hypothetical protein
MGATSIQTMSLFLSLHSTHTHSVRSVPSQSRKGKSPGFRFTSRRRKENEFIHDSTWRSLLKGWTWRKKTNDRVHNTGGERLCSLPHPCMGCLSLWMKCRLSKQRNVALSINDGDDGPWERRRARGNKWKTFSFSSSLWKALYSTK